MARYQGQAGFTLVELVIILIVLGIIAAVAIPRLVDTTGMKASVTARKLQSDIAYAQELAMTRNQRARVTFRVSPNGYDVTLGGNPVPDPAAGGNLSVNLNAGDYVGISISAIGFAGSYVEFSTLGVPVDGGGDLAAAKSVTVSGGSTSQTVTVQPQTGKVSVP